MQSIKLDQIQPYALQPEGRARDTTELQESHRHVGVLRPPIIVPDGDEQYTCLAGWRTITAAKAGGMKEILCDVREDLVGDPEGQFAIFIQSNIHRELTALEKAAIIKARVEEGVALKYVARQMAVSTTEVSHLFNLANAPDEVKELVRRGRDGLSYTTFKAELSNLSGEQMVERLQEAGDLSRRALKRARQRATGTPERILESTDDILKVVQVVRHGLAQVKVFLRTAMPESKDEVLLALRPVREIWGELEDG